MPAMTPFTDLAQFRELAMRLPPVDFIASGTVHPRLSLFAATRDAGDIDGVKALLAELPFDAAFTSAVTRADADLRLYELAIELPVVTLSPLEAAQTAAYGMTAIEPGPDLFALAALDDDSAVLESVRQELARDADPLAVLATSGRAVAALFGAIMAARMAELPVILDGAEALAAACVLHALNPTAISHCAIPQGSAIESEARALGLRTLRCNDPRPLYALANSMLHARALAIA